jgi:hypothetical protein
MSYRSDTNSIGVFAVLFVLGSLALIFVATGIAWLTGGIHYGSGYREGTVQKLSNKGIIFKTNEGEMAMSGFKLTGSDDSKKMTNVFEFTILDSAVLSKAQELHGNEIVRLYYDEYILSPVYKGSTGYRINRIERINSSGNPEKN